MERNNRKIKIILFLLSSFFTKHVHVHLYSDGWKLIIFVCPQIQEAVA